MLLAACMIALLSFVLAGCGDDETKNRAPSDGTGSAAAVGDESAQPSGDRQQDQSNTDDEDALFAGIPQSGNALGKPKAPVTIVEFADLKCPFCKQFSEGPLTELIDKYVRPGKVRLEFRVLSFLDRITNDQDSTNAATMAIAAAEQDKLWPFIHRFYANQMDESLSYVNDDFLRKIAEGVPGLDVDRAFDHRKSPQTRSELADHAAAFEKSGLDGTPGFMIGKTDGGKLKPLNLTTLDDISDFEPAIKRLLR